MEPAKSFRDLLVWQEAFELTLLIYVLTRSFPKDEVFGLTSQMRRAAVSITSNIAEGFGRNGWKEKDQFYAVANGSLLELESQLLVAEGVGYTDSESIGSIFEQISLSGRLLRGLIKVNKEKGNGK
jgi:four helix bundle protein